MKNTNRIKITKEIYEWAIKESQKDFDEIEFKFNNIVAWMSHELFPTYRQLEALANFLKVPFGYMFLDKAPKIDIIQSEFRTIGNKIPEVSKELKDTLQNIGWKRDWLAEYRRKKGWKKLIDDKLLDIKNKDGYDISTLAKEFLELDKYWYKEFNNSQKAFTYLRNQLEAKGITVMQNGVVGSNNNRKLNIAEFRGFLLYDEIAPVIFINSNDSLTGKIFTLIHEFIHFLLQKDDIVTEDDISIETASEKKINKITAEFLMPENIVTELWDEREPTVGQIKKISNLLHVSITAFAIKLKDMNKIEQKLVDDVREYSDKEFKKHRYKSSSGGNYYYTSRSRFGDSFLGAVIQGAEAGDISYAQAFRLLDNSSKVYDYFKEEFMGHEK